MRCGRRSGGRSKDFKLSDKVNKDMKGNFKKFGIVALLLIFLAVAGEAKLSLSGILGFMDDAEGKATIIIILLVLSGLSNIISLGFVNPEVTGPGAEAVTAIVNSFIKLLMPLYILAIILTGFYLLFASSSPGGRAKAKGIFWRLIFSMVLVTISLPLFQVILNVAAALTSAIESATNLDVLYVLLPFNLFLGAIITALSSDSTLIMIAGAWMFIFNGLIAMIIVARYIVLLILAMLFPFTIFFWYLDFPFTRAFGMNMMRWTFMWAFMSVVFVLVAGASQVAMTNYWNQCSVMTELGVTGTVAGGTAIGFKVFQKTITDLVIKGKLGGVGDLISKKGSRYLGRGVVEKRIGYIAGGFGALALFEFLLGEKNCTMTIFLSLAGTLLMIMVPLMMVGLLRWVGGALAMYGLANWDKPHGELFTLAGGILSGMGPGAIIMYGTQMAFRRGHGTTLLPTDKSPMDLKKAALGKHVGKLDLEKTDYWDVRKSVAGFERRELGKAVLKGGKFPEWGGKIKGVGSSAVRVVREGRVRETVKGGLKGAGHSAVKGAKEGVVSPLVMAKESIKGVSKSVTWKEKPIRESYRAGIEGVKEVWGREGRVVKGIGTTLRREFNKDSYIKDLVKSGYTEKGALEKWSRDVYLQEYLRRGKVAGRGLKALFKRGG